MLVYDIGGEKKRLLAVAEDRSEASLRSAWKVSASRFA